MNVIAFPTPVFECLSACRDGYFVAFRYAGTPIEVIGPFSTVAKARDWATEAGGREGVKLDLPSFSRWEEQS